MLAPQGFVEPATTTNAVVRPPDHLQLVPHSIEAEQALLGALAIDPAHRL
jgi:hypothetical protein